MVFLYKVVKNGKDVIATQLSHEEAQCIAKKLNEEGRKNGTIPLNECSYFVTGDNPV